MDKKTKLCKLIAKATRYKLEMIECNADLNLVKKIVKLYLRSKRIYFQKKEKFDLDLKIRLVGTFDEVNPFLESGAGFSQYIELVFSASILKWMDSNRTAEKIVLACQPRKEICDLLSINPMDFKTAPHYYLACFGSGELILHPQKNNSD